MDRAFRDGRLGVDWAGIYTNIEGGGMDFTRRVVLGTCFVALLTAAVGMKARTAEDAGRKEIDAFNKRCVELHEKMDTPGLLALSEGELFDLLPEDPAIIALS